MAEYIERKQLIGSLEDVIADYRDEHTFSTDFAATVVTDILNNIVKCQPAADVAPVRHGRWEKVAWWQHQNRYECNQCSICGCRVKPKFTYNYCPNCGAKMDLSDECKQEVER